jgi:hypothetical protein
MPNAEMVDPELGDSGTNKLCREEKGGVTGRRKKKPLRETGSCEGSLAGLGILTENL